MNRNLAIALIFPVLLFAAFAGGNSAQAITFSPGSSGGNGEAIFHTLPEACAKIEPKTGPAPLFVTITDCSDYATKVELAIWDAIDPGDNDSFQEFDGAMANIYYFPGTYPIMVVANNEHGTDTFVDYVTVTSAPYIYLFLDAFPTSGMAKDETSGWPGTVVSFVGITNLTGIADLSGVDTYYLWDFGDGTSGSSEDPTAEHTYEQAGTYFARVTAYSMLGTFYSQAVPIVVSPYQGSAAGKSADFVASPVTGTAPHVVEFNNLTAGNTGITFWDFGDGTTSVDANPKHMYSIPGSYTVTLTTDGVTVSKPFYINTLPADLAERSPAALVLSNDADRLAILKSFRDTFSATSPAGQGLLALYYKHSLELVSILQANPDILEQAHQLVTTLLPKLDAAANGSGLTLSAGDVETIKMLLAQIAEQASPELQQALCKIIQGMDSSQFLGALGITVQ
ncbi:MAG TPA: PKD domain-containing protein [Thermodesulfobacteriota bacterium]|nr:PKD domain-containing protein [Thermodesulfobacteriota bacterium]HNU70699.1 PKD domain-containing protein [Thermodesulfobacteriota bacterium]HOC39267.1 PKD domain-containing protein [Thermodesulfobacteriota bacterium]HQO78531.1 PKD domain-containing protein [Thermodesulfobacteriota bacterium]